MVRHILDIGSGRYEFDKKTLDSFIEEARNRPTEGGIAGVPEVAGSAGDPNGTEMQCIFDEVMALYHDYMKYQNVELLVRLKCRLEEVSIRYHSHVLAAEVLTINSCLPYEHRVPAPGSRSH